MTLLSRSSAMLNEIDPKQAQEQIQAVRKTLQEYAKQEAQLAQLITPASASAAVIGAGSTMRQELIS
jgi:methyl-accepting chemotaxis protein